MKRLGDFFQTADWKTEKHTPVIESPDKAVKGELYEIKVTVGREIAHPNTTEHHIRWIQVFFKPADEERMYQLAAGDFTAHGESVAGANQGPAYTEPVVLASVKLHKPGVIYALSFCNIHGLWESSKEINLG